MPISDTINTQIILKSRPVGIPQVEHFERTESHIPDPIEGQFLVRNRYISIDPAMRGWANVAKNYSEPVALGAVMRAVTAGEVIASRHPDFSIGDRVVGTFGLQEYAVDDGSMLRFKVPDLQGADIPLETFLGVLGSTGITAYCGLMFIGEPKPNDCVVVSTAAGAVGSVAGQIAKLQGCRTVGLTGSDEKVALCKDAFGYDAAINYKTANLDEALADACPDGVNVYFDNTAGAISDAVYGKLAVGARSIICGTASVAVWSPPPDGPRIERTLLVTRARFQGLYTFDYKDRWPEVQAQLCQWFLDGKLAHRVEIHEGIDVASGAIQRLYKGDNMGKLMVKI